MQEQIKWYRSPVEKEKLKELTKSSDGKAFFHILLHLFIAIILGVAVYASFKNSQYVLGVFAFLAYSTVFSFFSPTAAIHELIHRTVFKTKFWNEFFIVLFSFLTWTNYIYFRKSHLKHHQYTLHKEFEREVVLPIKFGWKEVITAFLFNYNKIRYELPKIVKHLFGNTYGEWEEYLFPLDNKKERSKLFWWDRITFISHLLVVIIIIITNEWILLFLITLPIYSFQLLNILCGATQHVGMQSEVDDYRLCCRSIKINPIFSFLYWEMNYHTEHHMYAGVPFYNLKKLNKIIKDDLPKPNSLILAWKEIFYILERQRKEPDYCYNPNEI